MVSIVKSKKLVYVFQLHLKRKTTYFYYKICTLLQIENFCDNLILLHIFPTEGFCFAPLLPPGNSSLFSYLASKNLALKPHPLQEFPMTFHGVAMDFCWNYTFTLEIKHHP